MCWAEPSDRAIRVQAQSVSGNRFKTLSDRLTGNGPETIIRPPIDMENVHDGPSGAVAQLGERSVRNAEVVGSIPIGSTNFFETVAPGARRKFEKIPPEGLRKFPGINSLKRLS